MSGASNQADGTPDPPVDLTQVGYQPSGKSGTGKNALREEPYNPLKDQENIRGKLALRLVWTLIGVVAIVTFAGLLTAIQCGRIGTCVDQTIELRAVRAVLELVFTPLVGLVGAITGFYFGEKSSGTGRHLS